MTQTRPTRTPPTRTTDPQARATRAARLIARIRERQLKLAVTGRIIESARYALLAARVREAVPAALAA